jgi:hypothetical protein
VFKNNIWLFFFLAIFTLISIIYAEGTALELNLQTVDKDTPFFERVKEKELGVKQQLKMVKVANCPQVSVPPATEAVVLYYSEVKLGSLQQNYGILVDFEGKDKLLWVDSNADGDF